MCYSESEYITALKEEGFPQNGLFVLVVKRSETGLSKMDTGFPLEQMIQTSMRFILMK